MPGASPCDIRADAFLYYWAGNRRSRHCAAPGRQDHVRSARMARPVGTRGSQRHTAPRHVQAPELAGNLRITADDLVACGVVSAVVGEEPDAAAEPMDFCRRAGLVIEQNLLELHELRRSNQTAVSAVGLA